MRVAARFCAITLLVAFASGATVSAQDVSDDSAVWSVIERSWQAERDGNHEWIETSLSANFVGWENDAPAPRDKASTRLWNTFSSRQVEMLEYELYPLSIIVHGDMAVAHYLFSSANKQKGEPVAMSNGRYTDVLVRVGGEWKFIAWHGGTGE